MSESPGMDVVVSLCKRRGFVFQSSEIYGGIGGFWGYGPPGGELKNNNKRDRGGGSAPGWTRQASPVRAGPASSASPACSTSCSSPTSAPGSTTPPCPTSARTP